MKIDRIDYVEESGDTLIRIVKEEWTENGTVRRSYHRTSIAPDADPDATIEALNVHLLQMNYPACSKEDVEKVGKEIAARAEHRAKKAAELTAARADRAARKAAKLAARGIK